MLGLLTSKASSLVGVDISNAAVKILQLSRSGRTFCVEHYGVMPLGKDAVVEKSIKKSDVVGEAIKEAIRKSGSTAKYAAVAVADSSVITKVVQMDSDMNEEEIEGQIALEADKYIPYPLEEVSMDFEILGPVDKNPSLMDVLLVASRRENVESRVDAVVASALKVKVVDVESYAMERASRLLVDDLPNQGKDQIIAVIDIGSSMTNLTVLYGLTTIFTREEVFGGELLTKDIMRHYGLTFAEAGLAKKQGNLPDDYVTEILQPFKESVVLQVRRSLQFFFSASQHNEVNHIILAGGTSTIPGLASVIEEEIGVPIFVANPFSNMTVASRVDAAALAKDASALMISCGLAMRAFDQEALANG